MMTNFLQSRQALPFAIIFFYLLPITTICYYFIPTQLAWKMMSWGLLATFTGTLALFWLLYSRERLLTKIGYEKKKAPTDLPVVEPNLHSIDEEISEKIKELQKHQEELIQEIEIKKEALSVLQRDKEFSQQRYEAILEEFHQYKENSLDELEQHKIFIQKLQEALDQQRIVTDKKQQQISQLETKVGDLTYEIKTLLHLAESTHLSDVRTDSEYPDLPDFNEENVYPENPEGIEPPQFSKNPINSCNHASEQLKRCLDIAQKMMGSSRFGENSRFRDMDVDNFALDLRRLCDSLRSENSCAILLYSPKDDKLIFANNRAKTLLGWAPEKIVQSFSEIIQEGNQEWKNTLSHIGLKNESQIRLLLRTKKGHDLLAHCHLGMIPTGIFRYHVIGVLHPA